MPSKSVGIARAVVLGWNVSGGTAAKTRRIEAFSDWLEPRRVSDSW